VQLVLHVSVLEFVAALGLAAHEAPTSIPSDHVWPMAADTPGAPATGDSIDRENLHLRAFRVRDQKSNEFAVQLGFHRATPVEMVGAFLQSRKGESTKPFGDTRGPPLSS
jgi:hypothetical protein